MNQENTAILEKYQACVLLHAVGDAMGYKNGKWEFKFSGSEIHEEMKSMGGIDELKLEKKSFMVSDDTILHLANAECLIEETQNSKELSPSVYLKLVDHYKKAMHDMNNRAPGNTTILNVSKLSRREPDGYRRPFNPKGGGCGVSMRSSCIGLRYSKPEQIEDLIAFSVESGRMTHHHPIGYLGGVAVALMTSYAIQNIPIKMWGKRCLDDLELAKKYLKKSDFYVKENLDECESFLTPWKNYLKVRNIETGENEPIFPAKYDVNDRDVFYKTVSGLNNWAGSLGHDSVLIAYDGLLGCNGNWNELCLRAMLHAGDNDSTGCIAGGWYGALYGFNGVPKKNFEFMEYKDRLLNVGKALYEISQQGA